MDRAFYNKSRCFLCVIIWFSVLCVLGLSSCQTNPVDQVLSSHIEAMGGLDNWKQLRSFKEVAVKDNGVRLTTIAMLPDKLILGFEKEEQKLLKAFDGQHGYLVRNGVYEPMRAGEAVEMKEEPLYYCELVFAKRNGYKLNYLGKEPIDSVNCHKIEMIKNANDTQVYWLDEATNLIVQTGEYSEDTKYEDVFFVTKLGDYRSIDGLMFPHEQTLIPSNGSPRSSKTESFEINLEGIDENYFKYQPNE